MRAAEEKKLADQKASVKEQKRAAEMKKIYAENEKAKAEIEARRALRISQANTVHGTASNKSTKLAADQVQQAHEAELAALVEEEKVFKTLSKELKKWRNLDTTKTGHSYH